MVLEAVVGSDCLEEMLAEMQRPNSSAIASISHKVAQYGPRLIELGLALLRGETDPPYNYVAQLAVKAERDGRMLPPKAHIEQAEIPAASIAAVSKSSLAKGAV